MHFVEMPKLKLSKSHSRRKESVTCGSGLTSRRIPKPLVAQAGITRVTDVTGLDHVGIPVFTAFRFHVDNPAYDNISIYNGKGVTKRQAKTGAVMEALERFFAERPHCGLSFRIASEKDLRSRGEKHLGFHSFLLPDDVQYRVTHKMEWVRAKHLYDGSAVWVPAQTVITPYAPPEGVWDTGETDSSGLAAAFDVTSAVLSGVLELIERDAVYRAERTGKAVLVDLSSARSPAVRWVVSRLRAAGLDVTVKEVTSTTGIPVFFAVTDDPHTQNPLLLSHGQAAHWDPETAVLKAVLEVAQGRLTVIQGAREDLEPQRRVLARYSYQDLKNREFAFFYDKNGPAKSMADYPKVEFHSPARALTFVKKALLSSGYAKAAFVELGEAEWNCKAVRVLIPGMLSWH